MWIAVALAILTLGGQSWAGDGHWGLVALIDGRGDLAQDALEHSLAFRQAAGSVPVAVHMVTDAKGGGHLVARWWWDEGQDGVLETTTWRPGEAWQAGDVADAAGWGGSLWPERRFALVVVAHGVAPEPDGGTGAGPPRVFAGARGAGMPAGDLGRAFRAGMDRAGREWIDLLVLECCYGASLEILAELIASALHVLAVPGEIPSPGLPWADMMPVLERAGTTPGGALAQHLALAVPADLQVGVPWSLTVADLAGMGSVEAALADLSSAALYDLEAAAAAVQQAQSRTGSNQGLRQVTDAGQLARLMGLHATGAGMLEAAGVFRQALEGLVVARREVFGGAGSGVGDQVGVTLFVASRFAGGVEGYGGREGMAERTGYGRFLEAYLAYSRGIVPELRGGL